MATLHVFRSAISFQFLIFHLLTLYSIFGYSFEVLITGNPKFDPQIALLGDARISDDGSRVQLTSPHASSSGLLLCKDRFKFFGSSRKKTSSFSTEFEFSFTGNGDNLSLVMGPNNFASEFLGQGPFEVSSEKGYLGIEFGASMDGNVGDSNTTLVSVSVNNELFTHSVTNSGESLKSWIDYDPSSKRLEIRLSKSSGKRPYNPIIAYSIDLSKMWEANEVHVALGSRNGGNLSDTFYVYSWRFRLRNFPNWMHSLPVDPHGSVDKGNESLRVHSRTFCPFTVLAGMIFATGCGALLAFMVLFVWAIFANKHTVFPIEGNVQPVDFRYEKISVVVEKGGKVVKN
ncbi:lectin-like protein At1g53070 [Manihot esculenta]|uniref:lectin-like protein At1g53070 n=1 Tax=Manihot esculenta TaxID=3983 RepID=UPI000B5D495F|nr:lectin-like protein At1g53070 [Manihot esculenta]